MLAKLQWRVLATLACVGIGMVLIGTAIGHPLLGLVLAAGVGCGYALVLALEFVLLAWRDDGRLIERATSRQLIRAWLIECVMALRVFAWRQPFRSKAHCDIPGMPGMRGVVFIHGYLCNRGFWNPWLARCSRAGIPCIAVNLEPVFGDIEGYNVLVEKAVGRLEVECELPPLLVGHSMGGLVARSWMNAAVGNDRRIHRAITIATPHQGTWLARFARTVNARQMRQDGDWLERLARREPAARAERFTCFYGHADNIVIPPCAAVLPGAQAVHLTGTPHVAMAFHAAVFSEVARWLGRPELATDAAG